MRDNTLRNSIICIMIGIFMIFGIVYLIHGSSWGMQNIVAIIVGCISTPLCFSAGIYGFIQVYREKHPDELKKIKAEEKKKIKLREMYAQLAVNHKKYHSMEQEVYWITAKANIIMYIILFFILTLWLFAQWSGYIDSVMVFLTVTGVMFLFFLIMILWNFIKGSRYYLIREIEKLGLELQSVNEDYMHGITFPWNTSLFNIADKYCIYVSGKICKIVPTSEIQYVTTAVKTHTFKYQGVKEKQTDHLLVIYTKTNKYWFPCPYEMMRELIMEEYERYGIKALR